ncbi:hypothetical protein GCM10020367_62640 [Streptomyces sannanensis]|uniref:Transposase Helix-turn-helix domain-containing protein n=1 Tax=Streptomyces sannanensis TaxID=285536 RepID=A0ABP6SKP4_9ACTN
MAAQPLAVSVQLDRTGLVLAQGPDEDAPYCFPRSQAAENARRPLSLAEALHARIRPTGTAEAVLREWTTGMPDEQWNQLIARPAAAREIQREAELHQRRGRNRQKVPAAGLYTGRCPGLTFVDRLLAALLYQRHRLPQVTIAPLFGVVPQSLNRVISQTRRLLVGPLLVFGRAKIRGTRR